jgi:hypothetical protein
MGWLEYEVKDQTCRSGALVGQPSQHDKATCANRMKPDSFHDTSPSLQVAGGRELHPAISNAELVGMGNA